MKEGITSYSTNVQSWDISPACVDERYNVVVSTSGKSTRHTISTLDTLDTLDTQGEVDTLNIGYNTYTRSVQRV